MTQYIEKLNRVEAIKNNGDILGEVIPFLREHGISFEYKQTMIYGGRIVVQVGEELIDFNADEYLVLGKAGMRIITSREFNNLFEEDVNLHKRLVQLESKLSKAMTDIKLLQSRTTIPSLATSLSNSYGK